MSNETSSFLELMINLRQSYKDKKDFLGDTSWIDKSKSARVEPLGVITEDLVDLEWLPTVLQTGLSVVTSYYLQAVPLSNKISGVEVQKTLESLNPSKDNLSLFDALESVDSVPSASERSFNYGLPSARSQLALERRSLDDLNSDLDEVIEEAEGKVPRAKVNTNGLKLDEPSNLAVGKMVEVTLEGEGDKSVTIPVIIRLANTVVKNNIATAILGQENADSYLVERFYKLKAGRIEFVKDFIFASDLIAERKKLLIDDDSGVFAESLARSRRGKLFGLINRRPSVADASAIWFISESVAKEVERKYRGKFDKVSTRKKIFKGSKAMIIVVISREWERATFYYKGINYPTEVSLKDMQATNKGKGPDIGDVLKTMTLGRVVDF